MKRAQFAEESRGQEAMWGLPERTSVVVRERVGAVSLERWDGSHHKRSDGWGGDDDREAWVKTTPLRYYRITVQWRNLRKGFPVTSTSLTSVLPPLQDRAANRHSDFAVETRTRRLARHNVSSALWKTSLGIPSESPGTRAAWGPWKQVMPWLETLC